MKTKSKILKLIKNRRLELGMSQLQISKELKMTQGGYSKLENGVYELRVDTLFDICAILKMELLIKKIEQ